MTDQTPGYQPPAYQPPPKKRKKWPWVLAAIAVLILVAAGGCIALVGSAVEEVDRQSKSETVITYRVTGDGGSAMVTYTDADNNMGQDTAASLPWEKKVTLKGFVKIASLTATNGIEAGPSTKVTCEILVDGVVKYTQSGTGPGASASCSGSID